jgi:hypothetical protein
VIVFATIFGVGFLILILSMIFGADADGDFDTGADFSDGGHGPGILSIKMLALLMVGFGAVGFGVRTTTEWTMFQASAAGLGGAVAVGIAGYLILRMFYASQASSTITDSDLLGLTAHTSDAISEGGYGEISCSVRGRAITFLARSADGKAIPRLTPVRIVSKSSGIVTVTPLNVKNETE